jgi:rhomboid protease GluP
VFKRQRTGSIICPGCGYLVGVNDQTCYNCGRWNPSLWGLSPMIRGLGQDMGFVRLIMVGSIGLFLATLVASGGEMRGGGMMDFLSPSRMALVLFGASGAGPVFGLGHWWSVLSAGWLHGGALHILFNMLWVRQLAPETAELFGPGRTVIIYTVAGVVGFSLSSIMGLVLPGVPLIGGAVVTVGASAPIFGLLGALVCYGRVTGSSHVGATAWQYAVILFVFGLIGIRVDNYAHAGGFVGGYLAARWLNPSARERVDHLVAALVCLALTVLSIVASLVLGLRLLAS